jgi:hypothetical protein
LPALLTGRLFDEQGRRMTPTHTNKKGVRYFYYVSQAALRKGAFGRVAAPELEALVVDAVRGHLQADSTASSPIVETKPHKKPKKKGYADDVGNYTNNYKGRCRGVGCNY